MKKIECLDDCLDLVTDPAHKKKLVKFLNSPMGVWSDFSEILGEENTICSTEKGYFIAMWTHPFDNSMCVRHDDDYRLILFSRIDFSEILSATTNYSYWTTI